MNRNSIRWRLPASYAVIALLAALSLGSVMLLVLRSYYTRQERMYLFGNAITLKPVLEQVMQSDLPPDFLQDQINGLAFLSQTQIQLLDSNKKVIADSGAPDPSQVIAVSRMPVSGNVAFSVPANPSSGQPPTLIYRDEGDFPPPLVPFEKDLPAGQAAEIIVSVSASPYGYGFVSRSDFDPRHRSSQAVSVPLTAEDGGILGELQFSNGPSYGADVIRSVLLAWLVASIFAMTIAALTGWFMSQRVTRPVLVLENATRKMENGDLTVRVEMPNEKQSEFLSLANSFNGMAEQVEQTVSTLRAFVADAAHELHTPLTALQANLELARDENNASARTRYLLYAQEQSQRLEGLVKSLLDLSRIEAAESKSGFETVDVIQLVREVGEQFASRAEQTERSFTMNVPEDVLNVMGNETQLRQVVGNLLENALKFTPAGGQISLDLARSVDEITLTVFDSGIGIPPEDLPHLFERFHRGRNVSEYGGNGLGLAIVKAIVDVHAGVVKVNSLGVNKGSTFIVTLPAYIASF
jgi:signal transduction histidine kinase